MASVFKSFWKKLGRKRPISEFEKLHDDILNSITQFLSPNDLLKLILCSKMLKNRVESMKSWEKLVSKLEYDEPLISCELNRLRQNHNSDFQIWRSPYVQLLRRLQNPWRYPPKRDVKYKEVKIVIALVGEGGSCLARSWGSGFFSENCVMSTNARIERESQQPIKQLYLHNRQTLLSVQLISRYFSSVDHIPIDALLICYTRKRDLNWDLIEQQHFFSGKNIRSAWESCKLQSYLVETKTDLNKDLPPFSKDKLKEIAKNLNQDCNYNISEECFFQTTAMRETTLNLALSRVICNELNKK